MGINLKPYNEQSFYKVKRTLSQNNRAAVIHPTGTGKSYIALKLIEENQNKIVIYLAPSSSIMHQIKREMVKNGIDFRKLDRYTYQKLTSMNKKGEIDLHADIIILDEFHHCGAPEWGKAVQNLIEHNPDAQILGLSATPMRYFDGEIRDMAEELFDGNVASEMSLEEAIANRILSEPVYTTGLYEYQAITNNLEEKIEECTDQDKKRIAQAELEKLKKILDEAVKGLPELLENSMTNKAGKYIVYCKDIKDMEDKIKQAKNIFGKVNNNMHIMSISSKKSDHENESTIRKFENDNDNQNLKLLFSVDMLNEGYHLTDLDGVIMMRPTHSPNLYYQQLGRALSVGTTKTPIVIDLVNNIDTVEIIEGFGKRLEAEQMRIRNLEPKKRGFAISEQVRQIKGIVDKIDELVKRRTLTNEKKFELMIEYMEETGEEIKSDTKYRGYNLGSMKYNLLSEYRRGTLKMDDELLKKFIERGILTERKRKIKMSTQEKYDFLMSMMGKSPEEVRDARMKNGHSYQEVRKLIQQDYNAGRLDLTEEQIQTLKNNRILDYSTQEKQDLAKKYGISLKSIVSILRKYDSVEGYIHKLKIGEISRDYIDKLLPFTGVTVSEQDITEEQKSLYGDLINAILQDKFSIEYVYDIDGLNKAIKTLKEEEQEVINKRYGLGGEQPMKLDEIGNSLGKSRERIRQIEKKALRKMMHPSRRKLFIVKEEKEALKSYEEKYSDIQKTIRDLNTIRLYFLDEYGNPKQNLTYTDLSNFHNIEALFEDGEFEGKTILDLRGHFEKKQEKTDSQTNLTIEELDLSVRAFNCLRHANIHTVGKLIQLTKEDLSKIRNMGSKTKEEIVKKIEELGLHFAIDTEIEEQYVDFKEPDSIVDTQIEEMGLSVRAFNCLNYANIHTVGELIQLTEEDLYKIRNMGRKTFQEIVAKVNEYGLKIGCTEEEIKLLQEEENHRTEEKIAIQEAENNRIKEKDILKLIKLCDSKIEGYSKDAEDIKKEIDRIRAIMERCERARRFYFEKENIINPNEIIPGIPNVEKSAESRIPIKDDNKITGTDIGKAAYDATVEECDKAREKLSILISEQKGDGTKGEQL